MKHTKVESLPSDRAFLHFDAAHAGEQKFQVDYELVIPLEEVDCRGTWDHRGRKTRPKNHRIVWLDTLNRRRIPLGRTIIGTNSKTYPFSDFDGSIELPFRDWAHAHWDDQKLGGLRLFYSFGGEYWELTKES